MKYQSIGQSSAHLQTGVISAASEELFTDK